jgi:prepilin-type processing-associated H-X9-DG protein
MRRAANVVVVVLILVICGGLTVVAVARVREAAARMGCTNNLKQIGMSVRGYGDSYDKLPAAAMPNPDLRPEQRLSWIVTITPYVEASNLYSRMDKAKGWEAEENRFAALMRLRYLQCPSFSQGALVSTLAPTDYVGVAGLGVDAAALPKGDPRAGLFGYDREVTVKDIQGLARSLLLVAETGRVEGAWTAAGPPTVRGLESDGSPYLGRGGQFGGLHWNGTNVLMADGSVRFLGDDTSADVLESMAVIGAGEE